MNPERIRMSIGGEKLEAVIGRGEDEELPLFDSGAFNIEAVDRSSIDRKLVDSEFLNQYLQNGAISRHTMRDLVDSIRLVSARDFQCSEVSFCLFILLLFFSINEVVKFYMWMMAFQFDGFL